MKELEYPFDAELILEKKKKLKKQLLAENDNYIEAKIAILGGSTTRDIRVILELFLLNYGIRPSFYESEYNQFYQDAMFPNKELEQFAPDIIYIHTSNRNIERYPLISDSPDTIREMLEGEAGKYTAMWERLASVYHSIIIQNNFEYPLYRLLGNREASDAHGKVNYITQLNQRFYEYANSHENFYINDINYLAADYGLSRWSDPYYWHMYKYCCAVPAIPYLAYSIAGIIKAVYGKNKKALVLDLDNTLWGGVVGDDGVDNLVLGQETPGGQVYTEFQNYIREQTQLGVILNIDSKNDYDNAIAGLNHPQSVLKPEDFIVIKANWEPKDMNITDIADELNILPESMVFVDDNPAERAIVSAQIPGIAVPEIGTVEHYMEVIDRAGYFENLGISQDDAKRNEMYKQNAKRAVAQASFENYEEYLKSLEMKAAIRAFEPVYMARIAQLTNKSNQFNLTTRRYTQEEIEQTAADESRITLYGQLQDKFGDNGIVSVVIGQIREETLHIELWIMSCRVLKRDMEFAMMDMLVQQCMEKGVKRIAGYYYPTAKNGMVKDFYAVQGFEKTAEDEAGNTQWQLDLADYVCKNHVIQVE
jgi:FkbH-like protein